jgi:hypothetical protein
MAHITGQPDIAVKLWTCIHKVLGSNLGQSTGYRDIIRGFPQFFEVNSSIVPQLCNDRLFLTALLLTFHQSSYRPTLYNLDIDIVAK